MSRTTEFLMNIRSIIKLHESMLREICGEYQLALIEATIISFLHNNPGKDTAADIVELRMLSKGCLLYTSALGDVRVRGGSSVIVRLTLGDIAVSNYMVVEKVSHKFDTQFHTMDLTLRGGEINV